MLNTAADCCEDLGISTGSTIVAWNKSCFRAIWVKRMKGKIGTSCFDWKQPKFQKKKYFLLTVINVVKDNQKTGVTCAGESFNVEPTFKSPPVPKGQGDLLVSSPCLSVISSSAGNEKGNYLPIRVNRRHAVGITTGLPFITATISCVHSQLPKHDLAPQGHGVTLQNFRGLS